jgi:hypothetical protein
MSKLADAIRRSVRTEAAPMGFGAQRAEPKATMLVGLMTTDPASAAAARENGADVVIVDARKSGFSRGDASKLDANLNGAWLKEVTSAGASELAEAGLDFLIVDVDTTSANALLQDKLGFVLVLPEAADEHILRSLEGMDLDAIFIPSVPSPLTLRGHLDLVRTAIMARKPLACQVPAEVSKEELEGLRAAGIVLLIVEGSPGGASRLKETVMSLPPRKRSRDERPAVSLPRSAPAHNHDDDDE